EALPGPGHINPALARRLLMELAKTGHPRGIAAADPPADRVMQGSLPLRAPHHTVNPVTLTKVLRQPGEKSAIIGMERAEAGPRPALEIDFPHGIDSRHVFAEGVFIPGIDR